MAADDTDFGTEMRGYKKDDVDKAIQDLRRELIKANADRADAAKEVKRLLAVNEDLQAELDETGSPTYSGLGTKLENTLRVAEEQSTRLIAQADIDAEKLRSSMQAEAQRISLESAEAAQSILNDAHQQADTLAADARYQAESLLSRSKAEAEVLVN